MTSENNWFGEVLAAGFHRRYPGLSRIGLELLQLRPRAKYGGRES